MQKITTFLMFERGAEEAANLYTSIFDNSEITNVTHIGEGPDGPMASVSFVLDGQEFMAFDGGPHFSFSEGISLFVSCKDQAEVDYFWDKLTENGGEESMCGWLKDRFGVSWQIIPEALPRLIGDPDPDKARRATEAMFQMRKIDIAALEQAHEGN